MENLLFLVIGFCLALIFTKQPVQIKVHYKHETVPNTDPLVDTEILEEKMLKDDPKRDDLYSKLDEALVEVNEIMGGSDR